MNVNNIDASLPVVSNIDWNFSGNMYTAAPWNDQDALAGVDDNDIEALMLGLGQWHQPNNTDEAPTVLVSEPLNLSQGLDHAQPDPPHPFADNNVSGGEIPVMQNVDTVQTGLWSTPDGAHIPTNKFSSTVPNPRLYYEIPTLVDGTFGALTGDSDHQSLSLSNSPSHFVFTTPIIHDPIRPAVSHPSQTPESQSTKKRKRTEDEDAQQLERPVHYVWIVWEPPIVKATKRRATVHKRRVNETLRINNATTKNRVSKDSVLARHQAPDIVSSQRAGPGSSPNTADEEDDSEDGNDDDVAEMSPSAREHEETQRMAVAALRREASGKYRCEMPGCDKLLSSPRETRRHIKKTKLHRHPDCKGEYACGHCGRRFGREDSMRRHLKNQICLKKMVSVAMDG